MISKLHKSSLKQEISGALCECRAQTLALFQDMDEATFRCQAHPDFSPVGWHLGHIAYTESLWLLERSAGLTCLFPQYRKLFAADGLPKTERVKLPTLEESRYYLDTVREKVLDYLEVADLEQEERLWRFLLQHESQHSEIITFVLELVNRSQELGDRSRETGVRSQESEARSQKPGVRSQETGIFSPSPLVPLSPFPPAPEGNPKAPHLPLTASPPLPLSPPPPIPPSPFTEMIEIPAGEFEQGNNSIDALDNERPLHRVYLDTYYIDRYPVTCGQYRAFIQAGGYENPDWWSEAGWEWLEIERSSEPLYWQSDRAWDNHPVCGVSWYEADAYSRFVGKRLPTEAEWEKAATWDAQANRQRIYPWGDETPTSKHCNHAHAIGKTTPVDAYPAQASAYGLYDALGNVWEWTATWFDGYEGFQYYPYIGYSQVYFDNQHRVLKGASWATRPWALRSSFRNWYYPSVRQIFAGFRCVTGGEGE